MSDLEPITREEAAWINEGELTPITRKEQYIKHLYDDTQVVPEKPLTREEWFINKAGEELHDVTIEQLNVSENGTYSETGKAYSPVTVAVPIGTKSITANGTYDATDDSLKGYSSVSVDVNQGVFGFHINGNESDPSARVTYLADAIGATPAHMDFENGVFDYGSWRDAWFIKGIKPCILGQNGVVQKYLDPNDYEKDVDGNTVAIDSTLVGANVMVEFPKIWYKVIPDADDKYSGSVFISKTKLDADYKDYAYIDYQGNHKDHFYMPAYNSSQIDNVLRSVSGAKVIHSLSGQQEIDRASANGNGWYTEDAGEIQLINFLLVLIGKSTNTQAVFGQGLHTDGTQEINEEFRTGVHNKKGLFYGTNSGVASTYTNAVKVFGIENWWGFQWRRYAGDVLVNGQRKIKLCYGQEDGSTVDAFNSTGSGYVNVGDAPSGTNGGFINKMTFEHDGMFSSESNGTSTTYYCDGQWYSNSSTRYAFRGGASNAGEPVGAFCVALNSGFDRAAWYRGACVSFK